MTRTNSSFLVVCHYCNKYHIFAIGFQHPEIRLTIYIFIIYIQVFPPPYRTRIGCINPYIPSGSNHTAKIRYIFALIVHICANWCPFLPAYIRRYNKISKIPLAWLAVLSDLMQWTQKQTKSIKSSNVIERDVN